MGEDDKAVRELLDKLVTDTAVGNARFRRALHAQGLTTLGEALSAPSSALYAKLDLEDMDTLESLREQLERDPESFCRRYANKHTSDRQAPGPFGADSARRDSSHAASSRRGTDSRRHGSSLRQAGSAASSSPRRSGNLAGTGKGGYRAFLIGFEGRARNALDGLADRGSDYLAYEALDEVATELEALDESFLAFFHEYRQNTAQALRTIRTVYPSSFLLFVANQTRSYYDGNNLWEALFERLDIGANNQTAFKRTFVSLLEERHMPTYGKDEHEYYYLYTALLHGGFTEDTWEELWETSLLRMVRDDASDAYAFGSALNGRLALALIRDDSNRYTPKRSVLNVLDKVPRSLLVPMLDSALGVARSLNNSKVGTIGVRMLTSSGLPIVALQALSEVERKRADASRGSHRSTGEDGETPDVVYLPEGELVLDLDKGEVLMSWRATRLPKGLGGCRADFYVEGKKVASRTILDEVGRCVLERTEIAVSPSPHYAVEIKLMQPAGDAFEEIGSLSQSFARVKPGCFEFLRMPDGRYRLRGRRDRIVRQRRVAYILKEGRRLIEGPGMRPLEVSEGSGEWEGRKVLVFEVMPGSSGSIVSASTGELLASWQEGLTATVDRHHVIGRTTDGRDLFGITPLPGIANAALPSVTIEALDGTAALDDLCAQCECDGKTFEITRRRMTEDADGTTGSVTFSLSSVSDLPLFARECVLTAKHREGYVVVRYRFAIIPAGTFQIANIRSTDLCASYSFRALMPLAVVREGVSESVAEGSRYFIGVPLSQRSAILYLSRPGEEEWLGCELALAGIDIELPRLLRDISNERPVCLADAFDLGPSQGVVRVRAEGSRHSRHALLMLGDQPVLFKELDRPGSQHVNLFSDASLLMPSGEQARPCPLTLTVFYGESSNRAGIVLGSAKVRLLDCCEGLGFGAPEVVFLGDRHQLALDRPALCDLHLEVRWAKSGRRLASWQMERGEGSSFLPVSVERQYLAGRRLDLNICPASLFGEPEYHYGITYRLERKR